MIRSCWFLVRLSCNWHPPLLQLTCDASADLLACLVCVHAVSDRGVNRHGDVNGLARRVGEPREGAVYRSLDEALQLLLRRDELAARFANADD